MKVITYLEVNVFVFVERKLKKFFYRHYPLYLLWVKEIVKEIVQQVIGLTPFRGLEGRFNRKVISKVYTYNL